MQSIKDWLVQDGEAHDDVLHIPCLPVNIRLLKNNIDYYLLIRKIVRHMSICLWQNTYVDYDPLLGISGANVGVPFNIVLVKVDKGQDELIMINPEIVARSDEKRVVESNCGSLCLEAPVEVERYKEVTVRYVTFGDYHDQTSFSICTQTFKTGTVQHEIDHNKGILITDLTRIDNKEVEGPN